MDKLPIEPSIEAGNSFMFSLKARLRDIAKALNPIAAVFDYIKPSIGVAGAGAILEIDGTSPPGGSQLVLNKGSGAVGYVSGLQGKTLGVLRWKIQFGNGTAESGGNAGSDVGIYRHNDAGSFVGPALEISRATGAVYFPGQPMFSGMLGAQLTGYRTMTTRYNVGMVNDGTSVHCLAGGVYVCVAQQLVNLTTALYFEIRRNGVVMVHGYMAAAVATVGPSDITASTLFYLNVGDYVNVYLTGTASAAYDGSHSSFILYKVA